jgi:replicative DNA helicase
MKQAVCAETDLQEAKALIEQNAGFTSSGYESLDILTGGLIQGGVTLIAARPAMGRFSLALNMVSRLSRQISGTILIFSPRFREAEVVMRLLQIGTGLQSCKFLDKNLTSEELMKQCSGFFRSQISNIKVVALTILSLEEILWECNRIANLQLLVVDSVECIRDPLHGQGAFEAKEKSLHLLKKLALDLDIPVVCTTGLHRGLERRKDKRPKLSDLTKIAVPEHLVDQVIFPYRYLYYDVFGKEGTELIVSKNNCGATGVIELHWDYETCRFDEIEDA